MLQYLLAAYIILRIMAHILPTSVVNRLRMLRMENPLNNEMAGEQQDQADQEGQESAERKEASDGASGTRNQPFEPSPVDIVVTRIMLSRAKKLPPDICDAIFDFAEYWAHSSNYIDFREEHGDLLRVTGTSPEENKFLLRSYPVGLTGIYEHKDLAEELAYCTTKSKPRPLIREHDFKYFAKLADYPPPWLASPVRKIVFRIRSRDQGWASSRDRQEYAESWTWFEVGLEKFDATQECKPECTYDVRPRASNSVAPSLPVCALRPLQPEFEREESAEKGYKYTFPMLPDEKFTIQRNRTAKRDMADHVVTWTYRDDVDPESDAAQALEDLGRGRGTGDGTFVRNLKMGDVITVWAKARFPGWANHIERVKIDVYWAV